MVIQDFPNACKFQQSSKKKKLLVLTEHHDLIHDNFLKHLLQLRFHSLYNYLIQLKNIVRNDNHYDQAATLKTLKTMGS